MENVLKEHIECPDRGVEEPEPGHSAYIWGNHIRCHKKSPEDFPDKPLPKSKMRDFDEVSAKRAMKQMQLEMKRMHQEIEFLKKIMATGVIESEDD